MNFSRFDFANGINLGNRFDFSQVVDPFRRSRAWTILATCALTGAVGGLLYALALALPLYSSTATVVVRGGTGEMSVAAATSMARGSAARGGDMVALLDGFLVQDYLHSADAMREVDERLGLFAFFPRGSADPLHPLPANPTPEQKLEFYRSILKVRYSLTRQTVEIVGSAPRADQAARITQTALVVSEAFINRYNERVRRDVLSSSEREVDRAEREFQEAQSTLRSLRNASGRLDPVEEGSRIGATIQQLEIQRVSAAAERDALVALGAPSRSPRLVEINARVAALERFIASEKAKLVGSTHAISGNLSSFESAAGDVEMSQEMLREARSALALAGSNLARQQRYLLTLATPSVPTQRSWPDTWLAMLAGLGAGLVAGMLWLLFTRAFGVD